MFLFSLKMWFALTITLWWRKALREGTDPIRLLLEQFQPVTPHVKPIISISIPARINRLWQLSRETRCWHRPRCLGLGRTDIEASLSKVSSHRNTAKKDKWEYKWWARYGCAFRWIGWLTECLDLGGYVTKVPRGAKVWRCVPWRDQRMDRGGERSELFVSGGDNCRWFVI